ncbi:MAG: nitrilase [Desulfobacterales bacterium]|nr:nitrilase [Desulfobacterales bacterium]
MNDLCVAAVVMRSVVGGTSETLNRTKAWVEEAASRGAHLICFPELNLTGYSVRERLRSVAETISGAATQAVVRMARDNGVLILAGLAEKDEKGRIFASHLVASPEGLQGVYRKCHLSPFEQPRYCAGDTLPVFGFKGATFAVELCYETHFPELSTLLALKGAQILFCPHASPRGTPEQKQSKWLRHLPARAYDNGVFVVACNQTGLNNDGLEFPGLAVVLNPLGEVIAKHVSGEEAALFVDLRAAELAHVRENQMRFFLPNRRPELYEELIKRRPARWPGQSLYGQKKG